MGKPLQFGALCALVAGATAALYLLHSPSPVLIGGLVGGAAFSLLFRAPLAFPDSARHVGMAIIGVGAGTLVDPGVVSVFARSPVEVIAGVLTVLIFTMATGLFLVISRRVNGPTALFASLGGAAAGVTAIAREMDADEAVVSAIQYARGVLVVVSVSVVAPFLGGVGPPSPAEPTNAAWSVLPRNLMFTAACLGGGLLLTRVVRISGSTLVIPMLLSMAVTLWVADPVEVPAPLLDMGYILTGVAVGFSFTPATVRNLARLFPLIVVQLVASIGGCAVLGILFARAVGLSDLSGYLAMSPGGLPAVAAIAMDAGTDVGLVVTMQVVRLLAAILVATVIGGIARRRARRVDDA
jgi:membrane AbrB-like protein